MRQEKIILSLVMVVLLLSIIGFVASSLTVVSPTPIGRDTFPSPNNVKAATAATIIITAKEAATDVLFIQIFFCILNINTACNK